ncbi:MAG TPA: universal stress protein [Solirubrobacteraceae bacterium]|nr:universal stress protein [Solirubrobacteraceae bacterium]
MRIIVGYDPKTCDLAPVDFGVAASRFTGAPLLIASVHGVGDGRLGEHQMREDLLADAAETLEELNGELHAQGITAEYRDLAGTSAPRALHELADSQDAGLLVIGSTSQGTVGRLLPGSTAQRLMHGAPCPIAVVPHGWRAGEGLRTIGVAYVDTEEGREALRGAHALARQAGAALRVLTVAGVGFGAHAETEARTAGRPGKDFDEVEGEHRVLAETAARNAVAELEGDVAVQVDAFAEDPAQTLIAVSENLDLLVCGSRGYGPVRAVLLGGVSRRVAAEAHCPVIVLPRGVPASLEALA